MAMSEDTRRKLNQALMRERLKKAGIASAILAVIGLYIAYQNLDLAVDNTQVAGVIETVEPFTAPTSAANVAQGPAVTLGVKLDDGEHVRVLAYKSRDPKIGDHIDVTRHHHHTGRVTYSLK